MNPKPNAKAAWLPLSEAAALAGVSKRAMQKRAAAGKIGARKIGDGAAARWEIDGRELDANQTANLGANREPTGREPGANLGANREPAGRELGGEREAELKGEIAFLRGLVEQRDRDAAELRAALREALRAMPKQLTASPQAAGAAPNGAPVARAALAPDREPTNTGASAAPLTYDDIADALERDLAAQGETQSQARGP